MIQRALSVGVAITLVDQTLASPLAPGVYPRSIDPDGNVYENGMCIGWQPWAQGEAVARPVFPPNRMVDG